MKKPLIILFFMTAIMGLMFFINGIPSLSSGDNEKAAGKKIQEKLVIAHTEIFGSLERPKVIFNHGLHTDALKKEGCKTCHPVTPGGDYRFDFPDATKKISKKEYADAYHAKCIGCHRKRIREKNKSLPIRCGDCHIKKYESLTVKYPVVEFDFVYHDKHVRKLKEEKIKDECGVCHHTYDILEDDESLRLVYEKGTEESCYYCHDLDKQRGPGLESVKKAAAQKGLSMRKASHQQCVNCHIRNVDEGKKAGPLECLKCHTGRYRTIAELAVVPRPDRDQPEKPFISVEDGKMKGVGFDHAFHQKNTRTCRDCHHETLQSCGKCHGLVGSAEGKQIILANAYHDLSSDMSCAGCHKKSKADKKCAGCHHHLRNMDVQSKGPKKEICSVCHSGKKEGQISVKQLSTAVLKSQKVPEKVTIKIIENQYEPATFPHLKIIGRLVGISNESKMATSFHRSMQTICRGCHHQSSPEAEIKDGKPPYCRNCHSITFDRKNINRPRLLAVYHRQCLACHENMDIKEKGCADCHKEKAVIPNSSPPILGGD